MPSDLIPTPPSAIAALTTLADRARGYAEQAKSENTRRAYAADLRAFIRWCRHHQLRAMPATAETLAAYLTAHAGVLTVATLTRHLSAIRDAHRQADFEIDTASAAFRAVWKGIRKRHGAPARQKAALVIAILRKAVGALPDDRAGVRDRALLLVGFAAALRRSELATLEVSAREGARGWIEATAEGLKVHLHQSKADQEGRGAVVGVPYGANPETCPVRAYRAWLTASGLVDGAAFRAIDRHGRIASQPLADRSVARIVKRAIKGAARAEGLTAREAEAMAAKFAGHSLRAGLATSAAANDAPGHVIQRQLRHARFDTTTKYIRAGQLFKNNAAALAGL